MAKEGMKGRVVEFPEDIMQEIRIIAAQNGMYVKGLIEKIVLDNYKDYEVGITRVKSKAKEDAY